MTNPGEYEELCGGTANPLAGSNGFKSESIDDGSVSSMIEGEINLQQQCSLPGVWGHEHCSVGQRHLRSRQVDGPTGRGVGQALSGGQSGLLVVERGEGAATEMLEG